MNLLDRLLNALRRNRGQSDDTSLVLSAGEVAYLRPVGGDKTSTHMKITIEGSALVIFAHPFAEITIAAVMDLMKGLPAYSLSKLDQDLRRGKSPIPVNVRETDALLFMITSVDVTQGRMTFFLGEGVELIRDEENL